MDVQSSTVNVSTLRTHETNCHKEVPGIPGVQMSEGCLFSYHSTKIPFCTFTIFLSVFRDTYAFQRNIFLVTFPQAKSSHCKAKLKMAFSTFMIKRGFSSSASRHAIKNVTIIGGGLMGAGIAQV